MWCYICNKDIGAKFQFHIEKKHSLDFKEYIQKYHPELGTGYCKVCGKPTKFDGPTIGFRSFCSKKCSSNSIEVQEKKKQTLLDHYGVDNPLKSKEVRDKKDNTCLEKYGTKHYTQTQEYFEKSKQTCMEKYGYEFASQNPKVLAKMANTNIEKYGVACSLHNPEIQKRVRKTNLERYGVEIPSKNEEVKKKHKQTCLDRYGVDSTSKLQEVKDKTKQTCMEKYGVENQMKNKEIQEKGKQTCLERYGVENPLQNEEIKEHYKQTCLERYGVESPFQNKEIKEKAIKSSIPYWFNQHVDICKTRNIEILESPEEWFHKEWDLDIHTHKFHCNIHNLDFETEYNTYANICPKCKKVMWSKGEREVGDYIESLGIPIIRNDRIQIGPKEIDIWIPSKNIGIEYNGEYWHQDMEKDLEKVALCESKGITLFFVWDTEWNQKKEEVKENLKRLLTNKGIN